MAKKPQPTASKSGTCELVVTQTFNVDYVREQVIASLTEGLREQVETAIKDVVEAEVERVIAAEGEKEIKAAIKKTLADGWSRTNEYGEVRGTVTLKDRISELLNGRDRYNSSYRWLDELLKKEIESSLKSGAVAEEIKKAQETIRAEVDSVIRAKLASTLRSALGVSC